MLAAGARIPDARAQAIERALCAAALSACRYRTEADACRCSVHTVTSSNPTIRLLLGAGSV